MLICVEGNVLSDKLKCAEALTKWLNSRGRRAVAMPIPDLDTTPILPDAILLGLQHEMWGIRLSPSMEVTLAERGIPRAKDAVTAACRYGLTCASLMERAGRIRELMADGYDVVLGGYWQGVCASCVEDGLEVHEMVLAFVRELPMPHVSILVDQPGNPGRLRDWLLELWSDMSRDALRHMWGLTACMTVNASLPSTLDAVKELIDKNIMITAQKVNSCRFVN